MKRHQSVVTRAVLILPAAAACPSPTSDEVARTGVGRFPTEFAQGYSCSPQRTCSQIPSCQEARWLLANCSWGGKLDRDGDGVPCEAIC